MSEKTITRKALPLSDRLGLDREEAAAYVGYSPTVFDRMVQAGEMPQPHRSKESVRLAWSRRELDDAFHKLPTSDTETSPWAGVEL